MPNLKMLKAVYPLYYTSVWCAAYFRTRGILHLPLPYFKLLYLILHNFQSRLANIVKSVAIENHLCCTLSVHDCPTRKAWTQFVCETCVRSLDSFLSRVSCPVGYAFRLGTRANDLASSFYVSMTVGCMVSLGKH